MNKKNNQYIMKIKIHKGLIVSKSQRNIKSAIKQRLFRNMTINVYKRLLIYKKLVRINSVCLKLNLRFSM